MKVMNYGGIIAEEYFYETTEVHDDKKLNRFYPHNVLDDLTRQRQQGQQMIARALARTRSLRPGLRAADVADLVHALLSPEMYRLLVVDRGWAVERYAQWLTSTLADQLFADVSE